MTGAPAARCCARTTRRRRDARGVRGDGPGRAGAGAARVPRGPRADASRATRAGGRPRERQARRQRAVTAEPGAAVQLRGVHRTFGLGRSAVHALRGVDLDVAPGELVALVGRSGSGKTTLLNVVGGLDRPDEGTVLVDGVDVGGAHRGRAGRAAPRPGRVRLPDVRPDPRADGGRERRPAAAPAGRTRRRARASGRAAPRARRAVRARAAAARRAVGRPAAAGRRSRARWPRHRGSWSPTSPPGSSTARRACP